MIGHPSGRKPSRADALVAYAADLLYVGEGMEVSVDVMTFLGREGWSAASIDPTGANLPPEHGPWTPFQTVSITEAAQLSELKGKGFHLLRRKENDDV